MNTWTKLGNIGMWVFDMVCCYSSSVCCLLYVHGKCLCLDKICFLNGMISNEGVKISMPQIKVKVGELRHPEKF